ncbi:MAG: MFS transporter [Nocardioidaceae bacterium]|nr:MFS transporter [Nocardioidaceae bacterium]
MTSRTTRTGGGAGADPRDDPSHPRRVLAVLLLACICFALAQTLVIPALPQIADSLGAGTSSTSWVLTGFLLSASVATPIVGKLGDLYGRGRVLTWVLVIFALGGVVNALAGSIEVLVAGRILQGVAGGVFPLAFGIVRETSPRERVPSDLSLLSAVFGIGGGIGLPLSGVIVDHADISWLFWINLVALPAALAAHRLIPSTPAAHRPRIDWPGAVLLSLALGSTLLGVTRADAWGWSSPTTLGLIGGGLVLAVLWVAVEARVTEPLIQLSVLRQRAVAATNATAMMVGLAMFASFLLIPQFAQTPTSAGYGFGMTVTGAGLLLVPSALTQLLAGPVAGRLGVRIGFRRVLALGTSFSCAAFCLLAFAHSSPWEFVVAGILLGSGICFAFAAMANLVVAATPPAQVGIATGINTVMRTVGGAFGSAVAAAILAAHIVASTGLPSEGAYTAAFAFSAAVAVVATCAALLVPRQVEEPAPVPVAVID